jgi:hypothetical protein
MWFMGVSTVHGGVYDVVHGFMQQVSTMWFMGVLVYDVIHGGIGL